MGIQGLSNYSQLNQRTPCYSFTIADNCCYRQKLHPWPKLQRYVQKQLPPIQISTIMKLQTLQVVPKKYLFFSHSGRQLGCIYNYLIILHPWNFTQFVHRPVILAYVRIMIKVTPNICGCPPKKNSKIFVHTLFLVRPPQTMYQQKGYKMQNSIKLCSVLTLLSKGSRSCQKPSTPK